MGYAGTLVGQESKSQGRIRLDIAARGGLGSMRMNLFNLRANKKIPRAWSGSADPPAPARKIHAGTAKADPMNRQRFRRELRRPCD